MEATTLSIRDYDQRSLSNSPDPLKHSYQNTPRNTSPIQDINKSYWYDESKEIECKIEEEENMIMNGIIHDLKQTGRLEGKKSLAFAFDVKKLEKKTKKEEVNEKLREFFTNRIKSKRK